MRGSRRFDVVLPGARGRRVGLLAATAAVSVLWAVALTGQAAASTPPRAATFVCDGHEQKYRIPAGTSALAITAVGAPGGLSAAGHGNGVLHVDGAEVAAMIPVTALPAGATTLYPEVGCPGSSVNFPCSGSGRPGPGPTPCNGAGGFNGGGSTTRFGGGGGGASDVRTTSNATALSVNDSRLVVAGGGGGEGSCGNAGGAAGDTNVTGPGAGGTGSDEGGSGVPCVFPTATGGNGGFGGTSGGAGGLPSGGSGSLGQGGSGDLADDPSFFGGAGGGGYYGGGAGGTGIAAGGGGGGGSSFWIPGATSTSISTDTTGTPEVVITPMQ